MTNEKSTYQDLEHRIKELENENFELRSKQIEISKAKELYLKIFEDFPALIWRSGLDKLCDYFNKTWLDFTGRTLEQEKGNGWAEGVHPDDFDFCLQIYVNAFDKRETFEMDYRLKNKSGEYRWIKDFGSPFYDLDNTFLGYIGSCYDITENKEREIQLIKAKENVENNERKFKAVFDNSLASFIIADDKGNYISVNKAATELFGYSFEEFQSMNVEDLITIDSPDAKTRYIEYIKKGEEKGEFNFINKKGVSKSGQYHAIRIEPDFNLSIMFEINEKKKAIKELIKAKEKAEESDSLKTAFLQNMSHEIRTPLNAISGFSGLLTKPELSEEKRKSFVSIIQNSSDHLLSIVSNILTISSLETKQEKVKISNVCINSIIVELLAIFKQQSMNQNISLYAKQQLDDKQSEIYTDKTKVTQILTNLLTNALKFTHKGFIEFGYNLKETELEFYVKDSGIGIKPEFKEKIFERFMQADKSINKLYGGTGLGLAISKSFSELLGGRIWVQSEIEKGSTFYFTIPYKPVNETDKATTTNKQNENFRTILVAEDEEYNFLFIEELLIDMDLKLIHAKDGKETVEIFKTIPNIDLILMDLKMPILDGYEAAKIIKALKPDLPIVAQSAYALEHERTQYEGIFDDYLTKPIKGDNLKQLVMKCIGIK